MQTLNPDCDCHGRWRPTPLGYLYIVLSIFTLTLAAHGIRDLVMKSFYGDNYVQVLYGEAIERRDNPPPSPTESPPKK